MVSGWLRAFVRRRRSWNSIDVLQICSRQIEWENNTEKYFRSLVGVHYAFAALVGLARNLRRRGSLSHK